MDNEFIPYEEALALKELGFDELCFEEDDRGDVIYFLSKKGGILYQQAFRWFRDKHNLNPKIFRDGGWWCCQIHDHTDEQEDSPEDCTTRVGKGAFNEYERAELACLKKLIEILKNSI